MAQDGGGEVKALITGARGMLAQAVREEFERRGHEVVALDRAGLDVTDAGEVRATLREVGPDAVVHCAAYTRVDDAEAEEAEAHRVNAEATAHLAAAAREVGARLVYPSTDYVFDGRGTIPYRPDSPTNPINAYGRSKLAGEAAALNNGDHLVVRTSWLYGAGGKNFISTILDRARTGQGLRIVADQRGSPTWTGSLAAIIAELLERGAPAGVYHGANVGETTWHDFALEALRLAGIETMVEAVTTDAFPRPAARPAYSVLDTSATAAVVGEISGWREALAEALPGL